MPTHLGVDINDVADEIAAGRDVTSAQAQAFMEWHVKQLADRVRKQVDCSDEYEKNHRKKDDVLPSVWRIQNDHIRSIINGTE